MAHPLGSYRLKFVFAVSALSLVTLGGALAVISSAVNRDQRRQLDEVLVAEAAEEARELAQADEGALLLLGSRRGPEANDVGPLEPYAALVDERGEVLRSSENFPARFVPRLPKAPRGCCMEFLVGTTKLRAAWAPVPGRKGQRVLLGVSRADLDADALFLRRAMLAVFGVACAWTVGVVAWTIWRLTRGWARVAEVARIVAAGNLEARVGPHLPSGELARVGQDVDAMIDRLGTLLQSQQRFIAHAAHELRTPLSVIYGELALALRKPRSADSYRETIIHALESTRRLKLMAEDLLALARLGSQAEPPSERVQLRRVLEEARALAANANEQDQIALKVGDEEVTGRMGDLVRLFRNLMENALRHGPQKGLVEVVVEVNERHCLVTVRDQGAAPPEGESIFEAFRKGKNAAPGGSGLGLAISRDIARAHGGALTLHEDAEKTTFRVRLRRPDPDHSP